MYDQVTLPFIAVSHHLKFIYQKMSNFCMPIGIFVFTKPVKGDIIPFFLYAIKVCFVQAAFESTQTITLFLLKIAWQSVVVINYCKKYVTLV